VVLARLVLDRPDLLLLDEPTTHFDLPSLEALEHALEAFEGAMLVASHDRYLLDRVARRLVIVDAGAIREVQGPYHTYRESLSAAAAPASGKPVGSEPPPHAKPSAPDGASTTAAPAKPHEHAGAGSARQPSSKARRSAREGAPPAPEPDIHAVLERIGTLEDEQRELSRLMGDPELYRDAARARDTVRRYEEVNAELETLYALLRAADASDADRRGGARG